MIAEVPTMTAFSERLTAEMVNAFWDALQRAHCRAYVVGELAGDLITLEERTEGVFTAGSVAQATIAQVEGDSFP
jgi:hypothetical protein